MMVAAEFMGTYGRGTDEKFVVLNGAPLRKGENHDRDVLPGVG
jgi:hypothetical protein